MIDEANLAFNLVDRSYAGLFTNLDHAQYAPPLFAIAVKACFTVFGVHEYALRLVPLLAGIVTLLAVGWTARKVVRLPYIVWITALLGFSWYFLRYGTEVKQYASDTALALLFIGWALHWPLSSMTPRRWLSWATGGAVCIWASMPIVFILAGIGLHYAYQWWQNSRKWPALLPLIGIVLVWLVSFGVYYTTILATDIGSDYLQQYHAPFFLSLNITSIAAAKAQYYLLQNLLATALPKVLPILLVTSLAGIYGTIKLWEQRPAIAILLLTPIVATLIASLLHLYTLIPRVSLFLLPIMLIVMAYGFQSAIAYRPLWLQSIVGVGLTAIVLLQVNITFLWQPMHIDPIKPAINYIQHTAEALPVVVHYEAVPAYTFYSTYYRNQAAFRLSNAALTEWDAFLPVVAAKLQEGRPFWVLIAHTPPEQVADYLKQWPAPTHSFSLGRAYAYLLQP